jgi:deazaflavin-dependent oxidoreductase (nitroreductase family)
MPALALVPMPNTRDSYSEEIMPDAATEGINGSQRQDHRGVLGERGPRQRVVGGHSDDPRLKWRIANHPSWYYNLKANPRVELEVGTETFTVLAEELDGTARAELWPKLIAASRSIAEFQAKTTRQIPLFVLTRED